MGMGAAMSRTVLVIDDDPDVLDTMHVLLSMEGYDVRCARSGFDALDILAREPLPALVITDLMMPDLTGWDVLAAMQAEPRLRDIPVVLTTAASWDSLPEGVDALQKPFNLDELMAVVWTYCPPVWRAGDQAPQGHQSDVGRSAPPPPNGLVTTPRPSW